MSDVLPVVGGTQVVDINPNAFPPGTMVPHTALTAANTTPVLTPVGTSPTWEPALFNGPRPGIASARGQGFSIPRPVQDDFTIYAAFRRAHGSGGPNWYNAGAFVDAEASFSVDDFGLNIDVNDKLIGGTGNPDINDITPNAVTDTGTHIITIRRTKATGLYEIFLDNVLVGSHNGNTNSLTASANIFFNASSVHTQTSTSIWGRIVFYDAVHTNADKDTMYAALAAMYAAPPEVANLKSQAYAVLGSLALRSMKFQAYSALGGVDLRCAKFIAYGVLAPETPNIPLEPPAEEVVDCPPDEPGGGSGDCCVPALNRLNEMRIGPLNTIDDLRKGIWLIQDTMNKLIREWNKLAAISQDDAPYV